MSVIQSEGLEVRKGEESVALRSLIKAQVGASIVVRACSDTSPSTCNARAALDDGL
jgi:hypothetical protein